MQSAQRPLSQNLERVAVVFRTPHYVRLDMRVDLRTGAEERRARTARAWKRVEVRPQRWYGYEASSGQPARWTLHNVGVHDVVGEEGTTSATTAQRWLLLCGVWPALGDS
jgi:hypothetical protein